MFYLTYLRHELRRRFGRTLTTVLGLGVAVALVVAVDALSEGLDRAQQKVLGPLAGVATDLMVTQPVQPPGGPAQGGLVPGGAGAAAAGQALFQENSTLLTDLASLGKPGERFSRDFFVSTHLSFGGEEADKVSRIEGVTRIAPALTLLATHQEGTVPEIVAELQTGGETFEVREAPPPMTEEERAAFQQCVQARGGFPDPGAAPVGPPPRGGRLAAFEDCLPARFREFTARFTTPLRTLRQFLGAPRTDITNESYTIAGIDPSSPDVGIISPAQLTSGRFPGNGEALLAQAYAERKKLEPGGTVTINGTAFVVAGIVKPPLSGQTADVYVPISELQALAGREGRANVLLVRTESSDDVQRVEQAIERELPGAQVSSAADLAERVSGSLVDSAKLADGLGLVLAVVALAAAFLIASLVTLGGIAKRTRELGTLKAIGWRQWLVVRQILAECAVQGVAAGVVGAAIGVGAAAVVGLVAPELHATASAPASTGFFGLGTVAGREVASTVALETPVSASAVLLAVALALAGGLVAGLSGALRAARLRPADAMRDVG